MNQTILDLPVRRILGISIHAIGMAKAIESCREAICNRRPLMIGMVNAAKVVAMRRDPFLWQAVAGCDLVLPDGMSIVWASRILGKPLPERVPGIDLFENLLALADRNGYSVFFLGATQEVLEEVVRQVRLRFPGVRVAGYRNGYFKPDQEGEVATEIHSTHADLLFVAITPPKKEKFLGKWGQILDIPVCHGVGGSFDVMAGKVRRAPNLWQKLGLEWLYRVVQEPGRMWKRYLITNTIFIGLVLRDLVGIGKSGGKD